MPGDQRMLALLDEAKALHVRKNTDYSGPTGRPFGNYYRSEEVGIPAFMNVYTRMLEKESRAANLFTGQEALVRDESLHDTMVDRINYIAIAEVLRQEWDARPYAEKVAMARAFLRAVGVHAGDVATPGESASAQIPASVEDRPQRPLTDNPQY